MNCVISSFLTFPCFYSGLAEAVGTEFNPVRDHATPENWQTILENLIFSAKIPSILSLNLVECEQF